MWGESPRREKNLWFVEGVGGDGEEGDGGGGGACWWWPVLPGLLFLQPSSKVLAWREWVLRFVHG